MDAAEAGTPGSVLEARDNVAVVYVESHVHHRGRPRRPSKNRKSRVRAGASRKISTSVNFIPFGTALVRRAGPRAGGLVQRDLSHGHRLGSVVTPCRCGGEFVFIDEPTYIYRIWAGQMSNNWQGRYEQVFPDHARDFRDEQSGRGVYAIVYPRGVGTQLREPRAHSFVPVATASGRIRGCVERSLRPEAE